MQDQRVVLRTALGLENMQHGFLVQPVGTEAVDRLGRDGDELTFTQELGREGDVLLLFGGKHQGFHDSSRSLLRSFSA